jgi:hypothetical protein
MEVLLTVPLGVIAQLLLFLVLRRGFGMAAGQAGLIVGTVGARAVCAVCHSALAGCRCGRAACGDLSGDGLCPGAHRRPPPRPQALPDSTGGRRSSSPSSWCWCCSMPCWSWWRRAACRNPVARVLFPAVKRAGSGQFGISRRREQHKNDLQKKEALYNAYLEQVERQRRAAGRCARVGWIRRGPDSRPCFRSR